MADPIHIPLGTVDIGTGGETAAFQFCYQYGWNIAPTVTGTPGTANYTLMVSNDNLSYFEYKVLSNNVPIEDAIQDASLNWSWIKIVVASGGPSAGSVSFLMELKNG